MTDAGSPKPPPLPTTRASTRAKLLGVLIGILALLGILTASVRLFGLARPFKVPTKGMAPTLQPGDHLITEGFTYLARKPRRGDVVAFRTDDIPQLSAGTIFVQRVAGEPGDRLYIKDGNLYVNDVRVPLRNSAGEIDYIAPRGARVNYMGSKTEPIVVPSGHYFLLGDNSANSLDSRSWGFVPAKNILGRASFRYAPPGRVGAVE